MIEWLARPRRDLRGQGRRRRHPDRQRRDLRGQGRRRRLHHQHRDHRQCRCLCGWRSMGVDVC